MSFPSFRTLQLYKRKLPRNSLFQLRKNSSSLKALLAAFRDPSSPFHIPPGGQGPASPDEIVEDLTLKSSAPHPMSNEDLQTSRAKLIDAGFHPSFIWQQPIAWGDQDSFQHVNNVRYVQFFESSRIHWMSWLGHRLGGPAKAEAFLKGQGISLILKSIEVNYRRPVTFPDTLLISHRPTEHPTQRHDPASIYLTASAFSVKQQAFVAHSNEIIVWYDYDRLRKCDPGEEYRAAIWDPFHELRASMS